MASPLLSSVQALGNTVQRLRDLARRQAEDLDGWKAAYEHMHAQLLEHEDKIERLEDEIERLNTDIEGIQAPARASKRRRPN